MADKTISRKLSALSNYFIWLVTEKVLEQNPMLPIPNGKVVAPLPDILYETECTKLLAVSSKDCRMYLLVLLLLETGLKIEEVVDLQLSHIDTSNAYAPEVWVKHTGKK